MSFFDEAYDAMTLDEISYRLPSELAVNALKRRLDNLPTLLDFIKTIGTQPSYVKELKDHINGIISNEKVADIVQVFDTTLQPSLFGWLNEENKNRIKDEGRASLDKKFVFNLAGEEDLEDLKYVLEETLKEPTANTPHIRAVLDKANYKIFPQLMNIIVGDTRPEVRETILGVRDPQNNSLISDYQRTAALKAFVKSNNRLPYINKQNFKSFTALKPKERLDALNKYLGYFPSFRQLEVFDPMPTQEEFDMILFAGCLEYNDLVVKLSHKYKEITQESAPVETDDEDEI
jgi:hypothetical protein